MHAPLDAERAQEVLEQAHKMSVRTPPHEQVVAVNKVLGSRLTSAALGIGNAQVIASWSRGTPIREDAKHRLQVLYRVLSAVSLAYDDAVAVAFMRASNPHLDNQAPIRVVADERPALAETRLLTAVAALLAP